MKNRFFLRTTNKADKEERNWIIQTRNRQACEEKRVEYLKFEPLKLTNRLRSIAKNFVWPKHLNEDIFVVANFMLPKINKKPKILV